MIYFLLARIFAFVLDLFAIIWRSDHEKDLEILCSATKSEPI